MTDEKMRRKYFEWLCSFVKPFSLNHSYRFLMLHLFRTDFYSIIPMDGNRASDGIELRYRFGREKRIRMSDVADVLDVKECSVLEMMIALSLRCEEQIIDDPDVGDRTRKLFWSMINNLGLNRMDDESYDSFEVEDRLDIFMNREYKPDGTGGLFKLRKTRHDLRNVEIWYQMMWYLSENM